MGTTKHDIRGWLAQGEARGATHLVVVCDTYDHEDYPVYVMPDEKVSDIVVSYSNQSMQRVMEVYSYGRDLEAQLAEHRSFHLD